MALSERVSEGESEQEKTIFMNTQKVKPCYLPPDTSERASPNPTD